MHIHKYCVSHDEHLGCMYHDRVSQFRYWLLWMSTSLGGPLTIRTINISKCCIVATQKDRNHIYIYNIQYITIYIYISNYFKGLTSPFPFFLVAICFARFHIAPTPPYAAPYLESQRHQTWANLQSLAGSESQLDQSGGKLEMSKRVTNGYNHGQ